MFGKYILGTAFAVLAALSASSVLAEGPAAVEYTVSGAFDDVVLDLENAVIGEGLVIDYVGQVNAMLTRTSDAVGASASGEKTPYVGAVYMHFCSALLTHAAVAADPANLSICPYVVYAYEAHAEPGVVHVGYRRPIAGSDAATLAAMADIEAMLDGIVKSVTE
jgi:hypothetical protein